MKKAFSKKTLIADLQKTPSYLRWSASRIAERFGCAEVTAKSLKRQLKEVKAAYNLKVAARNQNQPA